jgi:mannose-6-phosphate isomerase-like protein (cupin superfamily)
MISTHIAIRMEEKMRRLNFLDDQPWNEVDDESRTRARWFGHPFGADMLGASLRELLPGAPAGALHMHYGVEEMFFVLDGTPLVRTPEGEETLVPGDVVYFPEAPQDCTTSRTRRTNRRAYSPFRPSGFPMSSHIPSGDTRGLLRVIPSGR